MTEPDRRNLFPNYQEIAPLVPAPLWWPVRLCALTAFVALIATLLLAPDLGLKLCWGLTVPILPALFILAPGLWRNLCPLALLNQVPRLLGFGLARNLPQPLQAAAPYLAIAGFVVVVSLRPIMFNGNAHHTAILLGLAAVTALFGGILFKARSGWCGTFCPLGPIQRSYGPAPVLNVPQSYCPSCVGCQRSCQDLNPVMAGFDDAGEIGEARARPQQFFAGILPGLLLAYFTVNQRQPASVNEYGLTFVMFTLASLGVYACLTVLFGLGKFVSNILFGAAAITIFYFYAGPVLAQNLADMFHLVLPWPVASAAASLGGALGLVMLGVGYHNFHLYQSVRDEAEDDGRAGIAGGAITVDFAGHGAMAAKPSQNLLSLLENHGVAISANCRSGLCGSDVVQVIAGMDNLSPAGADETATLTRLGALGKARLACCVRIQGDVALAPHNPSSLSITAVPAQDNSAVDAARFRKRIAKAVGVSAVSGGRHQALQRVVIIGSGVAGITAAEELRRASANAEITIVSAERQPFYNRMALTKIIEGKNVLADLTLLAPDWHDSNDINLLLGCRVAVIDREGRAIVLEDGRSLSYDTLILATGASGRLPLANFLAHRNCFVLRTAEDALVIRQIVRDKPAKRALILGAGILGVETADALARMGLAVTIAGRGPRLMDQLLDEHSEIVLQQYLSRAGVTFKPNAKLQSLEGQPDVTAVRFADGSSLETDICLACIGVVPNADLARQAGLVVRNGIVVDQLMRSSDPHILAIGDVAEPPGKDQEKLWTTGTAQARQAVSGLLGEPIVPSPAKTIMRVKCEDLEFRLYGSLKPEPQDEIVQAPPFSGDWWKVVKRGNKIAGAVFMGPAGAEWPLLEAFRRTILAES